MTTSIGVLIVGLIVLTASLFRPHAAPAILFVMAIWVISAAGARLLHSLDILTAHDALQFTGLLAFAIIPICLWLIWVQR